MSSVLVPNLLLVVDDNRRFFEHVRHRVDQEPGWSDLRGSQADAVSADGEIRFVHIHADRHVEERLRRLPHAAFARALALVDRRSEDSGYDATKVCDALVGRGVEDKHIWPVSAYHSDPLKTSRGLLPTRRKGPRLLDALERELQAGPPSAPPWTWSEDPTRALHVLITGAGFEIREHPRQAGLPATWQLMAELERWPAELEFKQTKPVSGGDGFPLPGDRGRYPADHWERIQKHAKKGELDALWDELFWGLQHLEPARQTVGRGVQPDPLAVRQIERDLRVAFREVLLRYDWGLMRQSLDAASLDWGCWLSTNYTHHADRAIDVGRFRKEKAESPEGSPARPWEVLSLASSAAELLRMAALEPDALRARVQRARLLFKLHGDLAHVETMAIAGHDKRYASPLRLQVDPLYQLYLAARDTLIRALERRSGPVIWHLVGHDLKDQRLLEIIGEVVGRSRGLRHEFIIANPAPDAPRSRLGKQLRSSAPKANWNIDKFGFNASRYLARLRRVPFADREVAAWLRRLRAPFERELRHVVLPEVDQRGWIGQLQRLVRANAGSDELKGVKIELHDQRVRVSPREAITFTAGRAEPDPSASERLTRVEPALRALLRSASERGIALGVVIEGHCDPRERTGERGGSSAEPAGAGDGDVAGDEETAGDEDHLAQKALSAARAQAVLDLLTLEPAPSIRGLGALFPCEVHDREVCKANCRVEIYLEAASTSPPDR